MSQNNKIEPEKDDITFTSGVTNFLDSLEMRQKLLLLLVFPIIGMLSFSLFLVIDKAKISNRMDDLRQLTKIAVVAVDMVYELQRERGLSVAFASSKGKQFSEEMFLQREATDIMIATYKSNLLRFESKKIELLGYQEYQDTIHQNLDKIDLIRKSVSELKTPPLDVLEFYTSINKSVLSLVYHITSISPNIEISRLGSSFRNMLESTERLGLLRAMVSLVLLENRFDQHMFRFVSAVEAERQLFLQQFLDISSTKLNALYHRKISSPVFINIERILESILDNGTDVSRGNLEIDVHQWFRIATAGIQLMTEVTDQTAKMLMAKVHELNIIAWHTVRLNLVLTMAIIIAAFGFVWFISRSIISRINRLTHVANHISLGDWSVRVEQRADDELGLLGKTFNKMTQQVGTLVEELNFQKFALDEHAIVSTTDVRGNILYVNDKFVSISGYSREELIGKNHNLIKSNEHPPEMYKELWRTIVNGETWHGEVKNLKKDGGHYWVRATILPLMNENGKPHTYISIRTDITDKKDQAEKLISSTKKMKKQQKVSDILREIMEMGMLPITLNEYLNRVLEKILSDNLDTYLLPKGSIFLADNQSEQLTMVANKNLFVPRLTECSILPFGKCICGRVAKQKEAIFVNCVDEKHDVKFDDMPPHGHYCLPIINEDKLLGVLNVEIKEGSEQEKALQEFLESVTAILSLVIAQKQIEEELNAAKNSALDANKTKSDFLANMSHEIRTPMNAIIGMSHLALHTDLNRKQKDYVNKIYNAANTLLGIINDILDFSKMEAGKLEIEKTPFRLSEVLDSVSDLITVKAREKDLELLLYIDPEVPHGLLGDPLRLGQVITNLANNAIKFTEQGEIVIRVKTNEIIGNDITLQFSVSDTGIGLTDKQVDKLFQSFSQADASTTRKYGGTGLGLTICKQLTELMGGKIWVESQKGFGSTFSFTAQFSLTSEIKSVCNLPSEKIRGLKVLIVDDSPTFQEIMKELAINLSFSVHTTSSGSEAIELIKNNDSLNDPFRLVFMDWKMPEMNGVEASQKILADNSLNVIPKIIMVSAYEAETILRANENLQLTGFLTKPVTSSTLLDISMQALGYGEQQVGIQQAVGETEIVYKPEIVKHIRGAKILLVEDNEINQQIAKELLEMIPFSVVLAENGQIGIEKIESEQFDAVLMDIQMPVMDGYEATKKIRLDNKFADLPIIAMTANAMAGDREKALEVGMVDHIAKPINPEELFEALAKFIKPGERSIPEELLTKESATDSATIPLPQLPGVDMNAGVARLGGNRSSYLKLLQKFVTNQQSAVDNIYKALDNGEREIAIRIAHTLKGTTASIGALELSELAKNVERALITKEENPDQFQLQKLATELETLIANISYGLNSNDQSQQVEQPQVLEQSPSKEIASHINKIQDMILEYDSETEEAIEELLGLQLNPALKNSLLEVQKFVGQYNFEGASEALEQLVEKNIAS
ncbi:MAG: response regulator [Magnetococcales bacterium]|nr:response regulator [Magnetococcales bacterium]